MAVMKHERTKLVTFRTEEWMEELRWPATMKNRSKVSDDEEQRVAKLDRARGGRRVIFRPGPLVPVCGSTPDYRSISSPGWRLQSGLKI
jgi:hypothetical protein